MSFFFHILPRYWTYSTLLNSHAPLPVLVFLSSALLQSCPGLVSCLGCMTITIYPCCISSFFSTLLPNPFLSHFSFLSYCTVQYCTRLLKRGRRRLSFFFFILPPLGRSLLPVPLWYISRALRTPRSSVRLPWTLVKQSGFDFGSRLNWCPSYQNLWHLAAPQVPKLLHHNFSPPNLSTYLVLYIYTHTYIHTHIHTHTHTTLITIPSLYCFDLILWKWFTSYMRYDFFNLTTL